MAEARCITFYTQVDYNTNTQLTLCATSVATGVASMHCVQAMWPNKYANTL